SGPARHEVRVAVADGDGLEREAETVGDEHGERGRMSLAGRPEPGAYRRAAVGGDLDRPPLGLGEPVRDLDVHAQPDAHLAGVAALAPAAAAGARAAGRPC